MTTLDKVLTLIEALDDDFAFFSSQNKPPRAAAVDALEKRLGTPLAPAHRALIEKLGAGAVVAKETAWPRPEAYSIAPLWKHQWGFEVFGIAANAPLDAVKQTKARAPQGFVAALGMEARSATTRRASSRDERRGPLRDQGEEPPRRARSVAEGAVEDKVRLTHKSPEDEWLDKIANLETYRSALPQLMKEKPAVRAAVIELVGKRLAEDDSQTRLMYALGRLTEDARAITALQHYALKGPGRTQAIRALAAQKLDAKHLVPTLLACLADEDDGVIYAAAEKLGNYPEPSMVKPLAAALATVQKKERWELASPPGRSTTLRRSARRRRERSST